MKKYSNAVITGSISRDEIMSFPDEFCNYFQSDKLDKINISFVVDDLKQRLGGTATNIAYGIAHLGVSNVRILGAIGKDHDDFFAFFKKQKIGVDGIYVCDDLYTSTGKVVTDAKGNQIWSFYYGAAKEGARVNPELYISCDSLVVISANHRDSFMHFQNYVIKNKIDYLYDPGMALTWIKPLELKEGVINSKWTIGNEYEMGRILKICELDKATLFENGVSVITTLGEDGVLWEDNNGQLRIGGFESKNAIDPTGAGDAWRSGFVSALLENSPIERALAKANAFASFAVEKHGTVNHAPSQDELQRRINTLVS